MPGATARERSVVPCAGGSQDGGISAELVGAVVLIAALVAGLMALALPQLVGDQADVATCRLFSTAADGCEEPGTVAAPDGEQSADGGDHETAPDGDQASDHQDGGDQDGDGPEVEPRSTPLDEFFDDIDGEEFTTEEYRELSRDYVRAMLPEDDPTNTRARNEAITRAYAELYFRDPSTFKWAGMAAFASELVGEGIRQADAARQAGLPWIPGLSDFSFTELSLALQYGNALVYDDIFWQHVAYEHGGMDAIERAYEDGQLPARLVDAWAEIDRGRRDGDEDAIWRGNERLLSYEQQVTLQQGVYDDNRRTFERLSSEVTGLVQPLSSPIPGDGVSFQDHVPGGDVGDFDDRWTWISESMLPAWRDGEADVTDDLWELTE